MNATPPRVRIEMIEGSLRCFTLGLLGLLPVIGLPMVIMALSQYRRVKQIRGDQWNPAGRYLRWGSICAGFAVVLLALEIVFASAIYIQNSR
jgi:hypothetical protein